jgi:hypothetical protein
MVSQSYAVTYEVVERPDGRFSVLHVGQVAIADDAEAYDTREEAEDALFSLAENLDERASDLSIIKPGGGQTVF